MPRIILHLRSGNGGTVRRRPARKEACQCVPAESDAQPKGTGPSGRPALHAAPERVYSCGVRDLSDGGVGVRLNKLPLLPTEFDPSFDGFRTTLACRLIWRIGDLAGITFQTAAIDQAPC